MQSLSVAILGGLLLAAAGAQAAEFSFSGFGTLGGAISDESITYQRYIDDNGTLMRDSKLGVQVDTNLSQYWSATAQVMLAPRIDEDDGIEPQLKWTFLGWRPSDAWLIRAGRLSLGGMLYQQNMDVGVSYTMARLPQEVYLFSYAYDFDGLSISRIWNTDNYEIVLDGSIGMQDRFYRTYPNGSDDSAYYTGNVISGGFVLTVTNYNQAMFRAGWHLMEITPDGLGTLSDVQVTPLNDELYTLGAPVYTPRFHAQTLSLGVRYPLVDFLLSGEVYAGLVSDNDFGPNLYAGYVCVERTFGRWTPYLAYARSWAGDFDQWRQVKGATPVPAYGVSQALIDDTASSVAIFEQSSIMLGAAYALSAQQKIKAETMVTHVGERSALFDGDIAHENSTVFSLSYTFAF